MSKSLGNVIVPGDIVTKTQENPDPLRFFLSHEIPVGRDGDFSWERFEELYDAKLRNNVGNLLNRVLVLLQKDEGTLSPIEGERDLWTRYIAAMDAFDLSGALQYALLIADEGNRMIDDRKPWALVGDEKKLVLSKLAELIRHLSLMLLPFLPGTAQRMGAQLNVPYAAEMPEKTFVITDELKKWGGCRDWKKIGEPKILFPPLS